MERRSFLFCFASIDHEGRRISVDSNERISFLYIWNCDTSARTWRFLLSRPYERNLQREIREKTLHEDVGSYKVRAAYFPLKILRILFRRSIPLGTRSTS